MANDDALQPGAMQPLIEEAKDGRLTLKFDDNVRVNAEEFAYIERDCEAFKDEIRSMQRTAQGVANRETWGLGEDQPGLTSAQTLVRRFRTKAAKIESGDSDNNVHDILEQHYQIVDEIQQLHRTIAQRYIETDAEFAARFNELMSDMPESPISSQAPPPPTTKSGW